ncbi:MAG: iron-sulfur cluster carrier protein ApbC [Armatimonadota bacterium]
MSVSVTEKQVLNALDNVNDPEIGKSLTSLGMIKNININGNSVSLTLVLTTPACPMKSHMKKSVEDAVLAIPGVSNVDVLIDAQIPQRSAINKKRHIPGVKNVIVVASGKGGVGKSTVAVNLAAALALSGAKTALLDADIYGPSIPIMMGIHEIPHSDGEMIIPFEKYGIKTMSIGFIVPQDKAVIWRGPMIMKALEQLLYEVRWGDTDYLVIDMPPGTGDTQLTIAQKVPVTGAVIVTTPQDVALVDAVKGINMFNEVDIPIIGIIENMSFFACPHCNERTDIFAHGGGQKAANELCVPFLGEIPIDISIREAGDMGTPIVVKSPDSQQAQAFSFIAGNIAARVSVIDLS